MNSPIEDRLRAHFADRAARETLPGPEADATLHQTREGGGTVSPLPLESVRRGRHRRPGRTWLAVAAAAVLVAGIAGAVALVSADDPSDVSTDPRPGPTTTSTEPDREPSTTTTSTTGGTEPDAGTGPSVPAPPPAGTQPTGPFVAVEGMLGSWSGSAWVPWEAGVTPPYGDEYRIVGLADAITTTVGQPGVDCTPVGNPIVEIGLVAADKLAPVSIGVTGVGDPQPRPVEVLDPTASTYRDATVQFLASQGIDDPNPQVSQVVRSDIDGDGTTEVVVAAERISDPDSWYAAAGDYSVAFVRRVVGGEVRSTELAVWTAGASPGEFTSNAVYRVQALADLNGDGRMEVVLGARFWESSSTMVHELRRDGTVPEVLSVGCGV